MVGLIVLLPLIASVLFALLILGLIPVAGLRSWIGNVQRVLSATIGDTYVLLGSAIESAAIVEQVRRDLRWLTQRCSRVAVVAHSQGAAVAHRVLREHPPANVGLLCSVGSGIGKLEAILGERARSLNSPQSAVWPWLAPVGLIGSAIALIAALGAQGRGEDASTFYLVAALGAIVGIIGFTMAWRKTEPDPAALALPDHVRWIDYYGSSDPVPNGALFDVHAVRRACEGPHPADAVLRSRRVINGGSILSDHTNYWKNLDGFVGDLAAEIASLDPRRGIPLRRVKALDEARLEVAV